MSTYYVPPPYPPPEREPEPVVTFTDPPPWQTAIRQRRTVRANVLRRRLARRRALVRCAKGVRSCARTGLEFSFMLGLLVACSFLCLLGFLSYLWTPINSHGGRLLSAVRAASRRRTSR